MKNIGLNQHRFKQNPNEKVFAETWELLIPIQTIYGTTLDYLLAEDVNHPCGEVSERDRQVAATIIQWLVGISCRTRLP